MLLRGFGQPMAFLLNGVVGVVGCGLLLRYTPLLHLAVWCYRLGLWVKAIWHYWLYVYLPHKHALRQGHRAVAYQSDYAALAAGRLDPMLPRTQNFVEPVAGIHSGNDFSSLVQPQTVAAAPRQPNAVLKPEPRKHKARMGRPSGSMPSLELLAVDPGVYSGGDTRGMQRAIEQTLADFDVPVRVVHVESGPTVTQFGVEPLYQEKSGQRRKVRVNRIVNLSDDLTLALAAQSVRIEAPVPGQAYVGIEVPNLHKHMVSLRGILECKEVQQEPLHLKVGLGRNTAGKPVAMDLARAPHLLIAGSTGSGKSVCINTIIISLLMQHGPESLRFVMVDPKMVELPGYNGIPHLIGKVITETDQVMGALTWLLLQMDDRYRLFKELGVRNIDGYHALASGRKQGSQALAPMPYLVLIIDELADLMMTAADDIEKQLCRLAQMARATGIHMILATQRPSADVITGLIKANFPSRIAFSVTTQVDSRVILDTPGAERLLGRGDMLLMRSDAMKLFRLQGCFVSDDEINHVVGFWKGQNPHADEAVVPPWNGLMHQADDEDELVLQAIDVLRELRTCSTSMLQRKMRLGYPKAARLMEDLEAKGIVGPDMGGGQGREVLLKDQEDSDTRMEDEVDEDARNRKDELNYHAAFATVAKETRRAKRKVLESA
jgi:DNA segregation ATPase FtsK/SpoIIIE, S-DNA-T family